MGSLGEAENEIQLQLIKSSNLEDPGPSGLTSGKYSKVIDTCEHGTQELEDSLMLRGEMITDDGIDVKKVAGRLRIQIILSLFFFIVEFLTGMLSGSIALIADSYHMIADVMALIVAFTCLKMANKKSKTNTFGWVRAEALGGFFNGMFLLTVCLSIFQEALTRIFNPRDIEQPLQVLWVGVVGLLINIVGLFLLGGEGHGHSHGGGGGHGHSHGGGGAHGHSHGAEKGHGHGHSHKEVAGHGHSHDADKGHGHSHKAESAGHGHSHSHNVAEAESHGHSHSNTEADGHNHSHSVAEAEANGHSHRHGVVEAEEHGHSHSHESEAEGHGHSHSHPSGPSGHGHSHSPEDPHHHHDHSPTGSTSKVDDEDFYPCHSGSSGGSGNDDADDFKTADGDDEATALLSENQGPRPGSSQSQDHDEEVDHSKLKNRKLDDPEPRQPLLIEGKSSRSNTSASEKIERRFTGVGTPYASHMATEILVEDEEEEEPMKKPKKAKKSKNVNIHGVYLHLMSDAFGSIIVIITAAFVYYLPHWGISVYLDPVLSLCLASLMSLSAVGLVKESGAILMMNAPAGIDVVVIRKDLEKIVGVVSVCDVKVWSLTGSRLLASARVTFCHPAIYPDANFKIKTYFHDCGIHSTTIEPVFEEECMDSMRVVLTDDSVVERKPVVEDVVDEE